MNSDGLFSRTYGRFEWRAALPQGSGTWPALWMLGNSIDTPLGWPGCGEIDVVENQGFNPGWEQGSLHSGSDETATNFFLAGDSVTNFHTYTLDWTTNAFVFYVDGHPYETQTGWGSSTTNAYPYPFNQPFFLLMNVAIGGQYLGYPSQATINSGTVFPCEMDVDYVRVYDLTAPLSLSIGKSGSNVVLSWPGNIVCHLEGQPIFCPRDLGPTGCPSPRSPTSSSSRREHRAPFTASSRLEPRPLATSLVVTGQCSQAPRAGIKTPASPGILGESVPLRRFELVEPFLPRQYVAHGHGQNYSQ
jgi:hypothetical protein